MKKAFSSLLVAVALLALAVPASARTSTLQVVAHLVAARPTLPTERVRQLGAIEAAIDASPLDPASLDAAVGKVVGTLPAVQLLSYEAMALANLVAQRDADARAKSRALADALDRRDAALAQVTAARQAGQSITAATALVDSASDLSEMAALQLQMTMDRRSKLIDTLSNVLKKISDTGDSVVQNLK